MTLERGAEREHNNEYEADAFILVVDVNLLASSDADDGYARDVKVLSEAVKKAGPYYYGVVGVFRGGSVRPGGWGRGGGGVEARIW